MPRDSRVKFDRCPQCNSREISQTDYELPDGSEDVNGRACDVCHWEGDVGELVAGILGEAADAKG